jgi:TM2 domain-containing membrane protein YozV
MSRAKTKGEAWFWWLLGLLGLCGLHRFYLGRKASGWFYLLTLGVFGIGQILDCLTMGSMVLDANTRPYLPSPTKTRTTWSPRVGSSPTRRPMVVAVTNNYYEATGKVVTRVKCGYCGNVYPEGISTCTGCGAHLAA